MIHPLLPCSHFYFTILKTMKTVDREFVITSMKTKTKTNWTRLLAIGLATGGLFLAVPATPAQADSFSVGVTIGDGPRYGSPYPGTVWVPRQRCYSGGRYYWREGYYRHARYYDRHHHHHNRW